MKEENNSIYVKLDYLDANVGQVEGVPENPRKITAEKWDRLMDNVLLYPEYLRMNRLKCLEYNGRYVVLGGNQRRDVLYAISTMGQNELLSYIRKAYEDIKPEGFEEGDIGLMFEYWKEWQTKKDVPIVVTHETDIDTLKAYVALDNNSFGEYDWAKVKQGGWNVDKLVAWGANEKDKAIKSFRKEQEVAEVPFTEVLNESHNYIVLYFDNDVDWLQAQTLFNLKKVRNFKTAKVENKKMITYGVGRVIRGADALEKLRKEFEK